jgi:hypothetical protein
MQHSRRVTLAPHRNAGAAELTTASGQAVTALVGGTTLVEIGQTMSMRFAADDCHLFAADGTACPRTRVAEIARMHMPLAA